MQGGFPFPQQLTFKSCGKRNNRPEISGPPKEHGMQLFQSNCCERRKTSKIGSSLEHNERNLRCNCCVPSSGISLPVGYSPSLCSILPHFWACKQLDHASEVSNKQQYISYYNAPCTFSNSFTHHLESCVRSLFVRDV